MSAINDLSCISMDDSTLAASKKEIKWSAVSTSIAVLTWAFYLVLLAAASGWPGSVTSNCYEDYLVTADCYCERLRGEKPGDVWFAQPMNTVSNLWFVVSGLLVAYAADTRSFPSKEWWEHRSNPITENKLYSTTYAVAACLLGAGSTCLHASFTTWGRQVDMIAMYLLALFLLLYPFVKNRTLNRKQAIWSYCIVTAGLIYWTLAIGTPGQTRRLFTTMIAASWAIELFLVDEETANHNKQARKLLFSNIAFFIFAVLTWKATESAAPLCDPDSLWQGHSLWHLESAMAIAGQYFYFVAEDHPIQQHKKHTTSVKFLFDKAPSAHFMHSDSSSESGSVSS